MDEIIDSQAADFYDAHFSNLVYHSDKIDFREFYDCVFANCSFHEVDFKGSRFINCTFDSCDLSLAQMTRAAFRGTVFKNCKMIGIDWSVSSSPLLAEFFDCDLSYASFAHIDLSQGKITRCKAHEVYFWETNLTQADFSGTDFQDSQFKDSNLTKADFSTARSYTISPNANVLKEAKFSLPEAVSLLNHLGIVLVE